MVGIATHDRRMIAELEALVGADRTPRARYEFEMLSGIQREEQLRLARAGQPVRILISYGEYWYPWFVRRRLRSGPRT